MAKSSLSSLLRLCKSKPTGSRTRVLHSVQNLQSLRQFDNTRRFGPSSGVPYRQFSTSLIELQRFFSKGSRYGCFSTVDIRLFSAERDALNRQNDDEGISKGTEVSSGIRADNENVVKSHGPDHDADVSDLQDDHRIGDAAGSEKVVMKRNIALSDPIDLYKELRDSEGHGDQLTRSDWGTLQDVFSCFANSGWAANQALAVYIGMSFFPSAVGEFRDFFFSKCSAEVGLHLVSLGRSADAVRFLFPIFAEYCIEEFPDEIKSCRAMLLSADLTKPHTWFPSARAMKRKIVYHCGPTNSGKTYNALQRFMEAKNAIYCIPLRLLAMEVFDKVNALGVYCSLLTGQEKKQVLFANY